MRARLSIVLLLAAAAVAAQQIPSYKDLQYPPLPQVRIPEVARYTLPNGMKLFLLENRELPLVSGVALVRTGNLFDPPDKIGLAEFTGEVMRSGGTADKTGDAIDVQLENIAAGVEAGIGETSGAVSFNCLVENVDEVLAVFYDVLTAPEFRQDKLDLLKTQYRSVIARRNDDAGSIASREFAETVYGRDTPYGWRIEYDDVNAITRDDLVAFHQRYFFPANIILAIQGDFSADEMRAKLEALLAGWAVTQEPVPPFPQVTAKPAPGIRVAVKDDVNQTFFRIGHLGGILKDPDYPALEVMSDILGGGFSSRLFKKVRTDLGYAYNVSAGWGANYNHPGIFTIGGSTKSESTTDTFEAILQEVERIRTEEVTDEELEGARSTVLNSFVFSFDQPSETLSRLVNYEYQGYPEDFIFQYQKAVAAVTKADILRVAKAHLKPEDFTIVAVGNEQDFGRPLSDLNLPVTQIDLTIPEPAQETAEADADSLAEGRELLLRAQKAAGGAERLAAVRDYTQTNTAALSTPQGEIKATQVNRWIAPAVFRQDQELPFGKVVAFFDGDSGWLSTPQGKQPMPAPVADQVRGEIFHFLPTLLLSDRDEGRSVNRVSEDLVEISDGANVVRMRLDPDTGLPAALSYRQAGAPAEVEEAYSDWREVDGVLFPFRTTITQEGGGTTDVVVDEVRVNTGLTAQELGREP